MTILDKCIDFLWSQVKKGIYVYSGNGEDVSVMTEEQRDAYMVKRETETKNSKTGKINYTKEQNIKRDKALYEKRVKAGVNPILAFDCSGLQYWAAKKAGLKIHDMSANGFYEKCKPVDKMNVKRGDYCFNHNGKKATHIGMYVGDDIIIECQGRDVGVVTNKLSKTTSFNRFGRFEDFNVDPEPAPAPTFKDKCVVVKGKVKIIGNKKKYDKSVHVRSGNGTSYPSVGIAHSEDRFKLIEQEDSNPYWYKIDFKGSVAWITSNERYTDLIPNN